MWSLLVGDPVACWKGRDAMARCKQTTDRLAIEPFRIRAHAPSVRRATVRRALIPAAARAVVLAFLFSLGGIHGWARPDGQKPAPPKTEQTAQAKGERPAQPKSGQTAPQEDQRQMRGLDEQIQDVKSDVLHIAAELSQLEEKLLYPSGTQVAIFVALAKGDTMRLDAVRLTIDGQLVAHYIYSFKELEALRKGGVQRIYVGDVATGDHKLDVLVDGKLEGGADFSRTAQFSFRKEVKPKLVELTLSGPGAGKTPITVGE